MREALSISQAEGVWRGVLEVIETPVCRGVLLVQTATSRPLLPAEPRYTHLHKTHTSFLRHARRSGARAYTLLAVHL